MAQLAQIGWVCAWYAPYKTGIYSDGECHVRDKKLRHLSGFYLVIEDNG
jgi:hypothetical protein